MLYAPERAFVAGDVEFLVCRFVAGSPKGMQ